MTRSNKRLTTADWLYAGFRALAAKGPSALKAEPLARDLKTTKGSFYWHFKDVAEFKSEMLSLWEDKATESIIADLNAIPDPKERLRALAEIATRADALYGGRAAEPALRAWAREDENVAAAIDRVDKTRIAFLQNTLLELGIDDPLQARLIYAAHIGLETLGTNSEGHDLKALSDLVEWITRHAETGSGSD